MAVGAASRPAPTPLRASLAELNLDPEELPPSNTRPASSRHVAQPDLSAISRRYEEQARQVLNSAQRRWELKEADYKAKEQEYLKLFTQMKQNVAVMSEKTNAAESACQQWKWKYEQVVKMCTSLTYEHDECKSALEDQLAKNEQLLLRLREVEDSVQGKDRDLSFAQAAHIQKVEHLETKLKAAEQRADAADDRASKSTSELASWRQLQAEVARSLPTTWESKQALEGQVDPAIGHSIPRHDMLLHFSAGATTSPASQMQKDIRSVQECQNPVAVFRQVYRNSDGSQQGGKAATDPGETWNGKASGCSTTAHLREGSSASGRRFLSEIGASVSQYEQERLTASGGSAASAPPDEKLEEARRETARLQQVLKEVAELAKYYSRSLNVGYKRLMQSFLASQGTAKDSADKYGQAVNSLRALWGPQRLRTLETVTNAMARLSAAQVQANPQMLGPVAPNRFNLTSEERTAIKQECKRLVRAAQQHFFVVLSSSALISAPESAIRSPQQSPNRRFNENQAPSSPQRPQHQAWMPASFPGALATSAVVGNVPVDTSTASAFPTTQQLLVGSQTGGSHISSSDPGAWARFGPGGASVPPNTVNTSQKDPDSQQLGHLRKLSGAEIRQRLEQLDHSGGNGLQVLAGIPGAAYRISPLCMAC